MLRVAAYRCLQRDLPQTFPPLITSPSTNWCASTLARPPGEELPVRHVKLANSIVDALPPEDIPTVRIPMVYNTRTHGIYAYTGLLRSRYAGIPAGGRNAHHLTV